MRKNYYTFEEVQVADGHGHFKIEAKIVGPTPEKDIIDSINYCYKNLRFNKLERDGWFLLERDESLTIFDVNHPKIRENCRMGIEAYERDILRKKIKEFIND